MFFMSSHDLRTYMQMCFVRLLLVIVWSGVQLTIKSRVTKELRKNFTESEGRGKI